MIFCLWFSLNPTLEQLKEVEEAQKYPIEFDEDCEELSPAMMKAFKCAVVQRNCRKNGKYGTILWRALKKKKYL